MVPDEVQLSLHVLQVSRVDYYGILVRNNDDVLSSGTVGTVGIVFWGIPCF